MIAPRWYVKDDEGVVREIREIQGPSADDSVSNMPLRDYFAAKALPVSITYFDVSDDVIAAAATWCYRVADAMLKERAK